MRVFKFGGASVRDAENVRNVCNVLKTVGYEDSLIIASAMGKTTNALEVVVHNYFQNRFDLAESVDVVKDYHYTIVRELFPNEDHDIYASLKELFDSITYFLLNNKSPNYNFVYDQIVSYGEIISTTILHYYLLESGIDNTWLDSRNLIKTDTVYRDADVNWDITIENIKKEICTKQLFIVQGFIGSDYNGFSTTLGREGSDYSAAIFAYALDAESVTIWKDVPGVLNADPRYFEDTTLLQHISYQEAIELAFYGASVIHPKTLQPLRQKEIPLYVKSFLNPLLPGTNVSKGAPLTPHVPCFIVKKNQLLISLSSKDFSFIMEQNISDIFKLFGEYNIKVNVIQNSAISFSVCVEDKFNHFEDVRLLLTDKFKVSYNENVSLYTIRHFDDHSAQKILGDKTLLLKQVNRETMQIVTKE
ncbi:aspartate kinase [Myroides odoratimimus]|uniref:Aspartokinase n=3 Tax=Myroides odoratimimus TaxID=76832 RepID=A0A0S7E9S1_9FLAO|nr:MULTISPECIES: aspartate kinase [Myroides]AJA68518.1 aspartate kinase [Myroides sp. A21]ALU25796.1 aspartate kinase [Myroides odoratimimus]APA91837.1 aspartate kinase [Myroides sp. ZB35]EHO11322.1 aspartate kinase [Myroides odoratimimus CCUG 10230]EHO14469.1 aspartate kinase [Myroides odoratimimus CCUG 12901]